MSQLNTIENETTNVPLNQVIGCHLLNFLEGVDASNFVEAVNDSNQFASIAPTSDRSFIQLMKAFCADQKVLLPRHLYEYYLDECEVEDDKLTNPDAFDSPFIVPTQRLFVYYCFTVEGFNKLCKAYRTPSFQYYCRLLSFNTDLYSADFGLIDYPAYCKTIGSERDLNSYEKKFFKVNTYFQGLINQPHESTVQFVKTLDEFRTNLNNRFMSSDWLHAIDFTKFVIVGSCVVNALCESSFPDYKEQEVNFISINTSAIEFTAAVTHIIDKLETYNAGKAKRQKKNDLGSSKEQIKVEKVPGSLNYDVFLPSGVKLNFVYNLNSNSNVELSRLLYNFDMDICQVAFTGSSILCTFAFMQAMATKSFIVYSLHAEISKNACNRIYKYCRRGFKFLEPLNFDGNFHELMMQEEIPLYRVEYRNIIDENGECQAATTEYWRQPARNIDTFQLQEAFLAAV